MPSDREWNKLEQVISESTSEYTNSPVKPYGWQESDYVGWLDYRGDTQAKSMKSTTPLNNINPGGDSKPANE